MARISPPRVSNDIYNIQRYPRILEYPKGPKDNKRYQKLSKEFQRYPTKHKFHEDVQRYNHNMSYYTTSIKKR